VCDIEDCCAGDGQKKWNLSEEVGWMDAKILHSVIWHERADYVSFESRG